MLDTWASSRMLTLVRLSSQLTFRMLRRQHWWNFPSIFRCRRLGGMLSKSLIHTGGLESQQLCTQELWSLCKYHDLERVFFWGIQKQSQYISTGTGSHHQCLHLKKGDSQDMRSGLHYPGLFHQVLFLDESGLLHEARAGTQLLSFCCSLSAQGVLHHDYTSGLQIRFSLRKSNSIETESVCIQFNGGNWFS